MEINNDLFSTLDDYQEEEKIKDIKKNENIINLNIYFVDDKLKVDIIINDIKKEYIKKTLDIEEKSILSTPEWRYYGANDTKSSDPTRCGMAVNVLLPEASIGSTIRPGYYSKTMNHAKRMQDWNSMPYAERSLYNIYNELQEICTRNNLNSIISQESKSLYKIIAEFKISRGNNRIGIKAACIYFACKNCNVPRSTKEISEMFKIKNIIVTKGCKKFQEIIHNTKKHKDRINKNNIINYNDFIDRFCNKLNLNDLDIRLIKKIADKAVELKLVYQNTPPSIAAGSIYFYIKTKELSITKKDISDISKISEVTINKCYKKLENHNDL
jgi:transcription initiation factor TFIIB